MRRLVGELERVFDPAAITGTATTGSGRKLVKELFSADMEVDEITAHAKAAVFLHPHVDTIIEIGGQDSKFTRLRDGEVYFSAMNYACAAGTGSFIEEQAKRLGVSLEQFSELAFGSSAPYTSDRCTVYMERDLAVLLSEGWSKPALAAAVLNSVRDNYVAKVVGRSALGNHVVFQGATARNKALVASFEQLLEKPVGVSPYCHLTGAFGAALLCAENRSAERRGEEGGLSASKMKGSPAVSLANSPANAVVSGAPSVRPPPSRSSFLWEAFEESVGGVAIVRETCDLCANRCLLTVAVRDGVKTAWGMKCGREYGTAARKRPIAPMPLRRFRDAMKPLTLPQAGAGERDDPARIARRSVTVGLSTALYGVEYAPLWRSFLARLGFSVVAVSNRGSSLRILSIGKGLVNSDFCAPMIAAHGSIKGLLDRKVDYIFFPAVMNEEDEREPEDPLYRKKTRDAYFCYYSQYLPTIVSKLTGVDLGGKLISPLLALNRKTREEVALDIHAEMAKTFPDLSREETVQAFTGAFDLFKECRRSLKRTFGSEAARRAGGTRVALLGRPYVVLDPELNLDIPRTLEELGAEVYWQDEFDLDAQPLHYANKYYERMHWHYGKKILKVAEHCARSRNLYVVFVTCFRCSPDSFLMSYVRDIMDHYGKPFLFLQLDEHSSDVGYTTRIEAALRTFAAHRRRERAAAAHRETAAGESQRDDVSDACRGGRETAQSPDDLGTTRAPAGSQTRPRDDRLAKGDTVLVPYLDRLISRFYADSFIRAGYDALVLDPDEKALSTGYKHASGGECMPLVSIMGGAIEKTRALRLDPAKTFFFLPTSCYACNFPQFPILSDLAFRSAGLGGLKVGLLNSMSLGEGLSQSLAAKIFESGIAAGVLHKVYNRVKPYEIKKGETDAAFRKAEVLMSEAIRSGKDLRSALSASLDAFRRIERDETMGRKARVELLGDLYVKYSEAVNRNLQAFVEELGGELVVPSITEYALHYYYADIRRLGDDPRHYNLLRAIENRYERLAADIIGDQLEPDLAECARLMDEERFTHYITGETSINVGRALHAIRHGADAIVHANPIFCCPGVVSGSIFRRVQEESRVPIVDLFYDGTGNPNRLLIPHLYYLNRKRVRRGI
jgi:predicted CoA-substrate-specific enzyme activase